MSSKVHLCGFSLQFAQNISFPDFFDWLNSSQRGEFFIGKQKHYLLSQICDDMAIGVLITYDGATRLLATREQKGSLLVDKIALSNDQHSTSVSLFAINPSTMCGLFYNCHGYSQQGHLMSVFKKAHDDLKASLVRTRVQELTNCGLKPVNDASKKASEHYKGGFKFTQTINKLDLEQLIESYKEITAMEVASEFALDGAPMFEPISNFGEASKVKVTFDGKVSTKEVGNKIRLVHKKITDKKSVRALKLYGKSLAGEQISYSLGKNIQHFGETTLDRYVSLLPDDQWVNYPKCVAMRYLKQKMKSVREVGAIKPYGKVKKEG